MDYSVAWLPEALDDVDEIAAFIAMDSPAYASAFVQRIVLKAQELNQFPLRGRMVPEWGDDSVREVYVSSHRLIYNVHNNEVLILAVIHGARGLDRGLIRRVD